MFLILFYVKEVYKVITNLRTRIENDLVIELQDSVDLNLQIGSPLATSLSPWIRENQLYETINIPDKFMKELISKLFQMLMNDSHTSFACLQLASPQRSKRG